MLAGAYAQMPYEEIPENEYKKRVAELGSLRLSSSAEAAVPERFCDSDVCGEVARPTEAGAAPLSFLSFEATPATGPAAAAGASSKPAK
jgi:hypothetical protein